MAGHTPGPWSVFDDEVVADRTDRHICTVALEDGINPTEWQANLHVIAAAPELLEACLRVAARAADALSSGSLSPNDIRAVQLAIAKAEGR